MLKYYIIVKGTENKSKAKKKISIISQKVVLIMLYNMFF
jgi:hypothetical protein